MDKLILNNNSSYSMLSNPAISAAISLEYLLERKNFGPLSRSTESETLGLGPRSPNAHRSVNSDTHTEVEILYSVPHITPNPNPLIFQNRYLL